jgi:hypothetical protein
MAEEGHWVTINGKRVFIKEPARRDTAPTYFPGQVKGGIEPAYPARKEQGTHGDKK